MDTLEHAYEEHSHHVAGTHAHTERTHTSDSHTPPPPHTHLPRGHRSEPSERDRARRGSGASRAQRGARRRRTETGAPRRQTGRAASASASRIKSTFAKIMRRSLRETQSAARNINAPRACAAVTRVEAPHPWTGAPWDNAPPRPPHPLFAPCRCRHQHSRPQP